MNRKLTLEELEYVRKETKQKAKSVEVAYLLAILFGYLGVHLGYMEKRKSAVMRALLSISTLILLFLANTTVETMWSTELTMRLQQYSSALTVVILVFLAIQLIWTIYDLASIPKGVSRVNEAIENEATTAVIQSRYAAETIRKEETSKYVINEVTKEVNSELKKEIQSKIVSARDEINSLLNSLSESNENVMEIKKEISDEIESIHNKTKKEISTSENILNEKILELNETIRHEIEHSKTYLKPKDERINTHKSKTEENLKEFLSELSKKPLIYPLDSHRRLNTFEKNTKKDSKAISSTDTEKLVNEEERELKKVYSNEKRVYKVNQVESGSAYGKHNFSNEDSINTFSDVNSEVAEESLANESDLENKDSFLNVKEAIEKQNDVTVAGFIIGQMDNGKVLLKSKFNSNSNVVISDSNDPDNTENTLIVQLLGKSNLRQLYGLKSNPDLIGKKITVTGKREKYFNGNGLKQVKEIK